METYKPRGYGVNDFLGWNSKSELVLQPRFQRRAIWTAKARSYLIDTMLRQLPIPIIFLRQDVDPRTRRTVREVVDGQQRLRAIIDYAEGKFAILPSHNPEFGGLRFDELPTDVQHRLLDYEFSVVILVGATDADVLNVFSRLNSYTETLTPQEKLNAEFFGVFKRTMYDLGFAYLAFWRDNRILSDRQIVRMGEAELTSELVVAMLDGLQDGKKSLRVSYKRYEDDFPHKKKAESRFKAVIDEIQVTLKEGLHKTAFSRKAMFYSLFCVIYDILYGLPNSPTNRTQETYRITPATRVRVSKALLRLSRSFNKKDSGVADLRQAAISQTDRIAPRMLRHRYIWEAVLQAFHNAD